MEDNKMTNSQRGVSTPAIIALIVLLALVVWVVIGSEKEDAMLSDAPIAEQSIEDATSEDLSSDGNMDESTDEVTTEATTSIDVDISGDTTVNSN